MIDLMTPELLRAWGSALLATLIWVAATPAAPLLIAALIGGYVAGQSSVRPGVGFVRAGLDGATAALLAGGAAFVVQIVVLAWMA